MDFTISLCTDRRQKKYKEESWSWDQLISKLSKPVRTKETLAQYAKLSQKRQTEIKDVGGFVGGTLQDGIRQNAHFKSRSIVSLDADFAPDDFKEVTNRIPYSFAVYSTHKHQPGKTNRYRLLIPLKHAIEDADAYQAVARKIAEYWLDLEWMDDTTYQPVRLMFWPSVSSDGQYEMWHKEGSALDAQDILDLYDTDWHDVLSWPVSSREEAIRIPGTKAEDPLAKRGTIGAFCRAYTIEEAIEEFLSEVYCGTDTANRYTYAAGSGYGGLVVYDGKWAYSNHATDPAGTGHLQNAYDLVRIHKFGDNKDSVKKMDELVSKDRRVQKIFAQDVVDDFGEEFKESNADWITRMTLNSKTHEPEPTVANLELILSCDTNIKDGIGGMNLFTRRHEKSGSLPWWKFDPVKPEWSDADDAALRGYIETGYHIYHQAKIQDALSNIRSRKSFHPLREWLDSLEWDGIPRAEELLIDYLGADDTPYVRTVTVKHLMGSVARIYQPGIMYQTVLDIVGGQGIGKSYLVRRLCPDPNYFTDSIYSFKRKELVESMQGKWLCEIGEMAATKKADEADLKAAISAGSDTIRAAYGRHPETILRQCTFWGTTNDEIHLKDQTGNRRFWPVDCRIENARKDLFSDLTDDERDQIWAEAKYRWEHGEKLYLNRDEDKLAKEAQEAHTFISEEAGIIQEYLDRRLPKNYYDMDISARVDFVNSEDEGTEMRQYVCLTEIWNECLGNGGKKFERSEQIRLGQMLRNLGWSREAKASRLDKTYGLQRYFFRNK